MGSVVARATTAFCSFLALIKFMGKGKLLQLSRLRSPALAAPIPAVLGPPETGNQIAPSTNEQSAVNYLTNLLTRFSPSEIDGRGRGRRDERAGAGGRSRRWWRRGSHLHLHLAARRAGGRRHWGR